MSENKNGDFSKTADRLTPETPPPNYDDSFYRINDRGISGHHHHQTSSHPSPPTQSSSTEASAPPETPSSQFSTTFDSKRQPAQTFSSIPEPSLPPPPPPPAVIIQQQPPPPPPPTVIKIVREEPDLEDALAEGCCLCCTYCWARIACEICLQLLIGCARG